MLQASWRTFAIVSLTGGILWAAAQPQWLLREANQVVIRGNQLVDQAVLKSMLPLTYPRSLMRLRPDLLVKTLETHAPVEQTVVTRQLFPPRLLIEVVERPPIAITTCPESSSTCTLSSAPLDQSAPQESIRGKLWLVDSQGIALPLTSYPTLQQTGNLPALTLQGYFSTAAATRSTSPPPVGSQASSAEAVVTITAQRRAQWQRIYQLIQQSPVQVSTIDWRDPNNLVLKTNLGPVHIGPYSDQFEMQLTILAQMRQLPQLLDPRQVAYIDMSNPDEPVVELHKSPAKSKTE